jgi:heat shock protein HslJ
LTFQTGCNGGTATWETSGGYYEPSSGLDDTPEGQTIRIGDLASEGELCDGFLGEQDADIGANLEKASRFVLDDDGGGLLLLDEFVLLITEPAG